MTEPTGLASASELVERALGASSSDGCVVIVEDVIDANVRFANNTTTTNGVRRDRRVSVVAIRGEGEDSRVGVVSTSGEGEIEDLVAHAENDARDAQPADDASPLENDGEDDDFAGAAGETDLSIFSTVLAELAEAFQAARVGGRVISGFAIHEVRTISLGSSSGTRRRFVQPTGSFELVERTTDGSASTWAGIGTPDFADVSLSALDAKLAGRLAVAKRKVDLAAGRYEVILPSDAVADLVLEFEFAASGREAEDGGTAFSGPSGATRVGERLTEVPFDLYGDPHAPRIECPDFVVATSSGPDSSVFDNGVRVDKMNWLQDGSLEHLRYHRAGARRSHVAFAPAVDNTILNLPGAEATLEHLVSRTERGLLLTCLWYIREVDRSNLLVTGLTRDGVYLVEHGEIVGAVNNFRFNESPIDMLGRTIEAGRTERCLSREWHEWANRTAMPPLRVADFNMSSVSQAS
ncbi:MAG: metallopeptidase TldD-related protein [Acidimicrobiales bacterium]